MRTVTGGEGTVWHPCLVLLNKTEEQSHSAVWFSSFLHAAVSLLWKGMFGISWVEAFVFRGVIPQRTYRLAPLFGLAWSVTSLCSLEFCLWELHDCPVKLLCSSLNDSWVTADTGLQRNACRCRTFNTACHTLILKERSGSVRFHGSSFLRVLRYQELFLSIQCQTLVVDGF